MSGRATPIGAYPPAAVSSVVRQATFARFERRQARKPSHAEYERLIIVRNI